MLQRIFSELLLEIVLIIIGTYIIIKGRSTRRITPSSVAYYHFAVLNLAFVIVYFLSGLHRQEICFLGVKAGYVIYILLLSLLGLVSASWLVYVETTLGHKWASNMKKISLSLIPALVFIVLCIASIWTNWMFGIDANGVYHRGSLWVLQNVFCFGYCVVTIVSTIIDIIIKKKKNDAKRVLLGSMGVALIATVLQAIIDINLIPIAFTFIVLLCYINVYNDEKRELENAIERERQEQLLKDKEHSALAENNSRILALTDSFESLYDIELETGKYSVYIEGDAYDEEVGKKLLDINEYFSDLKKNIDLVVYEDDREELLNFMQKDALVEGLKNNSYLDHFYRINTSDGIKWYKVRVVYKDATKKSIIIGVFNAETEISKKIEEEQARENLINQLSGQDSIFVIDLINDTRKTVKNTSNLSKEFTDKNKYSITMNEYINLYVADSDKEMMRKVTSIDYISEHFKVEDSFTVEYRDVSLGVQRYFELRTDKLSNTEALQSVCEKDNEIINRLIHSKLDEDYLALIAVDLDAGILRVLKNDPMKLLGKVDETMPYTETMLNFASHFEGDAKEAFERISNIAYLKKRFATEDKATFVYRSHMGGGNKWGSATELILARKEDGTPAICAMGFSMLDSEAGEKEQLQNLQRKEREARWILDNITSTYNIVYIVNMDDDSVEVRRMDDSMMESGHDFKTFTEVRDFTIENVIHPRDKETFRNELEFSTIREKIQKTPSYSVEYCVLRNNATLWGEMSVTSIDNGKVIIGLSEKDLEIAKAHLEEKRYSEYFALFFVDCDTGMIRPAKTSPLFKTAEIGQAFPYEMGIKMFADQHEGETRNFFLEISNLDFVIKELTNDEKRTYSYKAKIDDQDKWIDVTSFVVERHEDGTPAVFSLGFSAVDALASIRQELQQRLNADMKMIGGLASEYHALYYYNIEENFFRVYSLDVERFPEAARIVGEGGDPLTVFRNFGTSKLVHPDDHHLFEELSIDYLKRLLAHTKKVTIRFRRYVNGEYLWTELHLIKYESIDEEANSVAMGFTVRDAEIRSEQVLNQAFGILGENKNAKDSINELLSIVGDYYGAERAYIFEFSDDGETFSNTYEWCAQGIDPMINHLQGIPRKELLGWENEFKRQGAFHMDALDSEHNTEEGKKLLEMQGIQSLVAAPIMSNNEIVGFIGVDNPVKAKNNVIVMSNVAIVAYSEILMARQTEMAMYQSAKIFADAFLESYVSAYYVNLDDCSQIIFTRDEYIEDKYGHIDNYLESINKYIAECVHEEDKSTMYQSVKPEYIKERLKNENGFSVYMRDISESSEKWYRFDVTRGSDDIHAGLAFSDVTERLEEDRQNAKRLEDALSVADAANKSKTEFLFNMSHDIRTPMNAIIGFTNMAKKYIDNKEKAIECLSKSQQASNMLLNLINSVLEVSRIESGHAVLDEQYGDVYYSFANIETTLKELAETKNIDLSFDIFDVKDRYVLCDFSRSMRIFVNVISNAIKYTPENGKVKITCTQVGTREDGYGLYQYIIEDNGIGMSEEFQKHVFEQFAREKTSTISGVEGTGLGMSVVKSFVDLMGGTIECISKQGIGTKFIIVLPFKLQKDELYTDPKTGSIVSRHSTPTNSVVANLKGKVALLVEDNELNREIAVEILEEEGVYVEEAENGSVAVKMLIEKGPTYYDFILMDIQMPVMNGYEATKKIRKLYPSANLPIVALSANAFVEDKEASLKAGMNAHIAKPIDVKMLIETLNELVNSAGGVNNG